VVKAIANATLSPDVPMEDARAAFNSRLEALARAHDILFRSNWARANFTTIIEGILAPYAARGQNRIRAKGPEISLGAKPALALGLALHERPKAASGAAHCPAARHPASRPGGGFGDGRGEPAVARGARRSVANGTLMATE